MTLRECAEKANELYLAEMDAGCYLGPVFDAVDQKVMVLAEENGFSFDEVMSAMNYALQESDDRSS
jgi:hypothetical protein